MRVPPDAAFRLARQPRGRAATESEAAASSWSTARRARTSAGPKRTGSNWAAPDRAGLRDRPAARQRRGARALRAARRRRWARAAAGLAAAGPGRADRPACRLRRRDRRRQRLEPHRRGAGPAACADLQLRHRLAHRSAAGSGERASSRCSPQPTPVGRRGLAGLAAGQRRDDPAALFAGGDRRAAASCGASCSGAARPSPVTCTRSTSASACYRDSAEPGALWIHAVSLGETRAARSCWSSLRAAQPGVRVLLTHGTATGRAEGERLLRAGRRAGLAAVGHAAGRARAFSTTSSRAPAC